jgi:hypothetical protein
VSVPVTARPVRAPRPAQPKAPTRRPRLRLVPPPVRRAPRAPFIAVVILTLASGLVGLLILNTQRAQDAFTLAKLQQQNARLGDSEQALTLAVQQDQDPGTLGARAAALGMVPGGAPIFLDAHGKVLGVVPAGAPLPSATSIRQGDLLIALPTAAQRAAAQARAARLAALATEAAQARALAAIAAKTPAAKTPTTKTPATRAPTTKTAVTKTKSTAAGAR